MDILIEQLVKRKKTADDYALRVLAVVLTVLVPLIVILLSILYMIYFITLGVVLFFIGIYMIVYIIHNQRIEFEYQVTNDNISVDKIINISKRRNICSLTISHINLFCHIDDKRLEKKRFKKRFDVSENIKSFENYVACFNTQKFGECCLIITPNDEVLEAIGRFLPLDQRYDFKQTMKAREQRLSAGE